MMRILVVLVLAIWPLTGFAQQDLRLVVWHAPLVRSGPGLLLRDLLRQEEELRAIVAQIRALRPDVLVLTSVDYDMDGAALRALADWADPGLAHRFALPPNSGRPTGRDVDGDGIAHGPRDAQGYGQFEGQGGLAVLSRWPIDTEGVRDLSSLLWKDLPDSRIAPDDPAHDVQRLSSTGHWIVPLDTQPRLQLLVFAATPPVFDGPEDRNGRRNADEIALWRHLLEGRLGPPPHAPFVIAGHANLDPQRGEGRRAAIRALLADPRLQDVRPQGAHGAATADWEEPVPGRLRVSYLLPSAQGIEVLAEGVAWPGLAGQSVHKPVWADLRLMGQAVEPAGFLDPGGGGG